MIWGKTNKERKSLQDYNNSRWFAWRPVQLQDGRWIWLERVERVFWSNWEGTGYDYFLKDKDGRKKK